MDSHRASHRERAFEQGTLPLFGAAAMNPAASEAPAPGGAAPAGQSRHLLAARKLSRQMRKLRDQDEAQTRAGLAICQHLRLLLEETEGGCRH